MNILLVQPSFYPDLFSNIIRWKNAPSPPYALQYLTALILNENQKKLHKFNYK